jgi:hypothetical protein
MSKIQQILEGEREQVEKFSTRLLVEEIMRRDRMEDTPTKYVIDELMTREGVKTIEIEDGIHYHFNVLGHATVLIIGGGY